MLTKKEIEKFQRITFEVYGIKITSKEALDQGLRLVTLFELMQNYSSKLAKEAINLDKKVVQND